MVRLFLLFIMTGTLYAAHGQDLISRTLEGLSCQSTEAPNELSKAFDNQKSLSNVSLFKWDNRKADFDLDVVNLKIDRAALKQLTDKSNTQLKITVPVSTDKSFAVNLTPFQVQSPSGKLLTPEGAVDSPNKMKFYRGIVDGDFGSLVTVSIINGDVRFAIYDQDGVYRISPSDFKSDNYAIWIDRSMQEKTASCGTTEEHEFGTTALKPIDNNEKAVGDIVQVYVECDQELYNDKGGASGVQAFVNALFAEVITLFANENINMEVSDIFAWSTEDPYAQNENLVVVLPQFATNIQNNYNGRIATLLKGDIANIPNSCSVQGRAYVNVLCNTYFNDPNFGVSGPYNVNRGVGDCPLNPNPTTSGEAIDVGLLAHELGHNIGSPHTHACAWGPSQNLAIDDCPGGTEGNCGLVTTPTPPEELSTIMSYCANFGIPTLFSKGFGTEPGNLMRNRVAAATCLVSSSNCVENVVYSNQTIPDNTSAYASNNITLNNTVTIANNATVYWQAENQFIVNGTLTVPSNAVVDVVSDECEE